MPILTAADAGTIRNRLGEDIGAETWDTARLMPPFLVRPIESAIVRRFPNVPQSDPNMKLAAAIMVAAAHFREQPEVQSSRLGDSQVTLRPGEVERIAASWEATAWAVLENAFPAEALNPIALPVVFYGIRGRR